MGKQGVSYPGKYPYEQAFLFITLTEMSYSTGVMSEPVLLRCPVKLKYTYLTTGGISGHTGFLPQLKS